MGPVRVALLVLTRVATALLSRPDDQLLHDLFWTQHPAVLAESEAEGEGEQSEGEGSSSNKKKKKVIVSKL